MTHGFGGVYLRENNLHRIIHLFLLVIFSSMLLAIFWSNLRNPRRHGFYRYLAFETLLVMVVFNADNWFQNPFSPWQIISWILLIASAILAVHGFYLLRVIGKPEGNLEATTQLVKQGAYRLIRHPLYDSLLLLGLGIFFKDPSWAGGSLVIALVAFLIATARVEEAENLEHFGSVYAEYMKETKLFIPYII
jgi:protein-S-isoprenylcysteine O-methyltransferase Ste14